MVQTSNGIYDLLIWGGTGLSLLGLAGLIWCILRVSRAKRAKLSDEDLRRAVQAVIPLNLGSLLLSVTGLMLVVAGVMLG